MNILDKIQIILVETSHPGNIGATARAMKTMGLQHLRLVNPKEFPHAEATARASNAEDILSNAQVYSSLAEALQGCHLTLATTARVRPNLQWKTLELSNLSTLFDKGEQQTIAILFGPERTGLTNAQLASCDYYLTIPCNPEYSSLNLASSVQIICYEIRKTLLQHEHKNINEVNELLADHQQLELLFEQIHIIMHQCGFIKTSNSKKLMLRLRRLFLRRELTASELHLLRGLFKSIEQNLKGESND